MKITPGEWRIIPTGLEDCPYRIEAKDPKCSGTRYYVGLVYSSNPLEAESNATLMMRAPMMADAIVECLRIIKSKQKGKLKRVDQILFNTWTGFDGVYREDPAYLKSICTMNTGR